MKMEKSRSSLVVLLALLLASCSSSTAEVTVQYLGARNVPSEVNLQRQLLNAQLHADEEGQHAWVDAVLVLRRLGEDHIHRDNRRPSERPETVLPLGARVPVDA